LRNAKLIPTIASVLRLGCRIDRKKIAMPASFVQFKIEQPHSIISGNGQRRLSLGP
jgi:hypothetical protein